MKRVKSWYRSFGISIIIITMMNSTSIAATLGKLNDTSIACQDKSSFDMAINCIADDDSVCMARLIADGKCKLIEKEKMEDTLHYTFSTIPQVLAALIALGYFGYSEYRFSITN